MGQELTRNEARPINIFLESLNSETRSVMDLSDAEREARAQKDEAILVLLAQLALVYWRPDFSPGQAKQLYAQYLEDLRPFAFKDVAEAVQAYRQNLENKFFPTPGQLRGLITKPYSWDPCPKRHFPERLEAGQSEMQKVSARIESDPRKLLGSSR